MKNISKKISLLVATAVLCINSLAVAGAGAFTPRTATRENIPYALTFTGDWDLIKTEGYQENLEDVFFSVYPRACKRWGLGSEAKTVFFEAVNDDSDAWSGGDTVAVGVDFANRNPDDLGFFAHELVHQSQSYSDTTYPTLVYPGGSRIEWWIEGLASYGGFRYFHWAKEEYKQILDYKKMAAVRYKRDGSVYRFDWLGEASTIDNGTVDQIQWFFAWMDYNYPTTKDAYGNKTPGLIDTINLAVKNNTYNDSIFVDKTGYTMFQLMEAYTRDVNENGWRFTGFQNYKDNWLVEDIAEVENPHYPISLDSSLDPSLMQYFDSTIEASEGFSYEGYSSGGVYYKEEIDEGADNLFDGDTNTRYCTGVQDKYVIFAMSRPVTVKSYNIVTGNDTSFHTGRNPESWMLYGSNDLTSWSIVDSVTKASRTMEAANSKSYKFIANNSKSYKYYKLAITSCHSGDTVQISEFSINGNLSLMDRFNNVIDASEGLENEGADNLFDSDVATKYCVNADNPYVIFSMKQPVTAKSYSIAIGNDTSTIKGRNPESWKLYGSNDQNSWTIIDSISQASDIIDPVNYKTYRFTTNNSLSYKYYKVVFTSCYSGDTLQLSEFSIYAD